MRNYCDSKYIFFNQKWKIFLKENIYRRFENLSLRTLPAAGPPPGGQAGEMK